jgi:hypothetical protein
MSRRRNPSVQGGMWMNQQKKNLKPEAVIIQERRGVEGHA